MSPAYLHQRLRYEPATGRLYWKAHAPHGNAWNTRWAGREAFTATDGGGYRTGALDGRQYRAHRIIWAMVHGIWAPEIDHEDHRRTNNRIRNLRKSTRTGNSRNQPQRAANTSGVTGVGWYARDSVWVARIGVKGRNIHLGYFDSLEDAATARKTAEREHNFHANHGK